MKKVLFEVNGWAYYDNFTYGQGSKWKIKDGLLYWWNMTDWLLEEQEYQQAYRQYLLTLITNDR